MRALILAAGLGRRLRPITRDIPKPVIPLLNKPIIEHLIETLLAATVEKIYISVGYKKKQFKFLERYPEVKILENPNFWRGNVYSLYCARRMFREGKEKFLVIPGDVVIDPTAVKTLIDSPNSFTLAVSKEKTTSRIPQDAGIGGISGECYSTGIATFDPYIFEVAKSILPGKASLKELIKACISKMLALDITDFYFRDVDTLSDFSRVNFEKLRGMQIRLNAAIEDSGITGFHSIVASDVKKANVEGSVIWNSKVQGCSIKNSIILNSRLLSKKIKDSVVYKGRVIWNLE